MAELYITSHQTYLKTSFDINYSLVKKKFQQHYLYIWNIFYYWYLYPGPLFLWRFIYSIKLPWSPILLNTETRAAVHLHLYLGMRSSCFRLRPASVVPTPSSGRYQLGPSKQAKSIMKTIALFIFSVGWVGIMCYFWNIKRRLHLK